MQLWVWRFGIGTKIPRALGKAATKAHWASYLASGQSVSQYVNANGLTREAFITAVGKWLPGLWEERMEALGKTLVPCEYCAEPFYQQSSRQRFCSTKCSSTASTDASYFGGNRRKTLGLSEQVCQLCLKLTPKGLSSHHVIGKGNDPDNQYLEALCRGCHQIVTEISKRAFVTSEEAWQRLIRYAILRNEGAMGTVHTELTIRFEGN